MLFLFKVFFQQHQYPVWTYTNIGTAYPTLSLQPPHIIIVQRSIAVNDDGIAFCRQVRQDKHLAHIPVLIGWADMGAEGFLPAYQAGANGCFGRMFNPTDLHQMITTLVHNPRATGLTDQT